MFCTSHNKVFEDQCPKCVANWTEKKEEEEEKPEPRTGYGDRPIADMRLFADDRKVGNPFGEAPTTLR